MSEPLTIEEIRANVARADEPNSDYRKCWNAPSHEPEDCTHGEYLPGLGLNTDAVRTLLVRVDELQAKLADMVGHLDDPETPEQWRTLVNCAPYVQVRSAAAEKLLDRVAAADKDIDRYRCGMEMIASDSPLADAPEAIANHVLDGGDPNDCHE